MRLADSILTQVHTGHRKLTERTWSKGSGDRRTRTWPEAAEKSQLRGVTSVCNICGWRGRGFEGVKHSESALCPVCGSISRDRFLYWCWTQRTAYDPRAAVLETSPRMGQLYRDRMAERVDYTASDYDESAHKAVIKLDLQDMALPDASVDVVLTPHVLEHVPDTGRALSELFRVLKPGGHVFLQIPLPQARTMVPTEPEYHGDWTLVYFRFGWDLADVIRSHGFACDTLVTSELRDAAAHGHCWVHDGPDCDVDDLVAGADPAAMTVIADAAQAERHGFQPGYQFVTFDLHKPR
ncbi:MAG: Methyltransferase type 11 [Frankiales bacterium]|nr:Methyltransferase type 11 [Frankiales bacterium]